MAELLSGDAGMITVKTRKPITLASGILQLSRSQIALRTGQLKVLDEKAGMCVIEKPVMFKAGETFMIKNTDRYLEVNCDIKKPNIK